MKNKDINQEVLDKWSEKSKHQAELVKCLGEVIGYGNMMSMASALWQLDLNEKHGLSSGAFIPTLASEMKVKPAKKAVEEQQRRMRHFKTIFG